jgi:apolipoprotein N-acyltransferase
MAIFGINACMILFGGLQEKYEKPGKSSWIPFWFGSFAGIIPWIAIAVYVAAPGLSVSPPGFVYGIIVSLFVFFNCFAINMVLQYKQVGRWRDYLFGEKVYIILSLTAKALLAWQVFANVLVLK